MAELRDLAIAASNDLNEVIIAALREQVNPHTKTCAEILHMGQKKGAKLDQEGVAYSLLFSSLVHQIDGDSYANPYIRRFTCSVLRSVHRYA